MVTQITLFLLTLTFTLVRSVVDFGQCYAEHVACFGILNGMRSWGSNDGCIMYGNCNIILYTRKNEGNEYYFTLISKWRSDFNSSSARFQITNLDTVPFDPMEHMQAVVQRNRFQTIAWADVYHDNKRIKMNSFKPAWSSTYYYFNNENSDTQTSVDFNTRGPRLEYFGPGVDNFPRTNLEDYVHVHLQFHKNGQLTDFGSTDQKFLLFRPKNSENSPTMTPEPRTRPPVLSPAPTVVTRATRPPIATTTERTTTTTTQKTTITTTERTTTTTTQRTTPTTTERTTTNTKRTTTTTQAPITQRTKEAKEEKKNSDETESFPTTSSQDSFSGSIEKSKGNNAIMISVVVMIAILVIGIGVYCCLKKKPRKRHHTSRSQELPESLDAEQSDVLERIRGCSGNVTAESGNYKKSYDETRDDESRSNKRKSKSTERIRSPRPEAGVSDATTIFNPEDQYSTYFKR